MCIRVLRVHHSVILVYDFCKGNIKAEIVSLFQNFISKPHNKKWITLIQSYKRTPNIFYASLKIKNQLMYFYVYK